MATSQSEDLIFESILKLLKSFPVYSTTFDKNSEVHLTSNDLIMIWKYHRSISETYKNKYGYKYKILHWLEDTSEDYNSETEILDNLNNSEFKPDQRYISYYNSHPLFKELFEAHIKSTEDHLIVYVFDNMILMQHHSDKIWKIMYNTEKDILTQFAILNNSPFRIYDGTNLSDHLPKIDKNKIIILCYTNMNS